MSINNISGNTLLQSGFFPPVRVASIGSPLTPSTGGLLTVDGITLVAGDRVLCKDEASAVNNGIYAANTGPWVRTSDASTNQQFFSGMGVVCALGAINAKTVFLCTCTDDPVVVGTSLITWASQIPVGAGNVTGPGGSTAGDVATFADTSGKLLQDTSASGTGPVVKATSPTLTSPTLGAATATSINKVGITQPAGAATLTIANSATFAVNNSLTLSATSGKTVTFNASTTFSGTDGKTVTFDNTMEFAGTDSTKFTFPGASDTIVGITSVQTISNKTFPSLTATTASIATINMPGSGGNFQLQPNSTAGQLFIGSASIVADNLGNLTAAGIRSGAPGLLTGTTGTVASTFTTISASGTFTVTLPLPTTNNGQVMWILNQVATAVNSVSANIIPLATSTAVSTLFAASAGKFAMLVGVSTSNAWQTMIAN